MSMPSSRPGGGSFVINDISLSISAYHVLEKAWLGEVVEGVAGHAWCLLVAFVLLAMIKHQWSAAKWL